MREKYDNHMLLIRLFAFVLLILSCSVSTAQVQRGVVKTPGRLQEDGSCKPGNPVPEATISIKDGNDYLTDSKGEFAFSVPEAGIYRVSQVTKVGYQLTDHDVVTHDHQYTDVPLYILLESDSELQNYRRTIERKVRTNYQNKIYLMQDQLEALRREGKSSQEELSRLQMKIDEAWDKAEQYVREMADRYLRIDYDFEDDFYREIGHLILNGELERADSMLRVKGSIVERIEKGLTYKRAVARYNEETVKLCDYKCEVFSQLNKRDSVALYLELKASLDIENIDWQFDVIKHRAFVMFDSETALKRLSLLLDMCFSNNKMSCHIPQVYCLRGDIFREIQKLEDAMMSYEDALCYYLQYHNESKYLATFQKDGFVPDRMKWIGTRPELIPIYTGMANCLALLSNRGVGYNKKYIGLKGTNYAFDLYWLSMMISEQFFGKNDYRTAQAYYEYASWQCFLGDLRATKTFCDKIITSMSNQDSPLVASAYLLMGEAASKKGKHKLALRYAEQAIDEYRSLDNDVELKDLYELQELLGDISLNRKQYDQSIEYYLSALNAIHAKFGEHSTKMIELYRKIGNSYAKSGNIEKALLYFNQCDDLCSKLIGEDSRITYLAKYYIGSVLSEIKE